MRKREKRERTDELEWSDGLVGWDDGWMDGWGMRCRFGTAELGLGSGSGSGRGRANLGFVH